MPTQPSSRHVRAAAVAPTFLSATSVSTFATLSTSRSRLRSRSVCSRPPFPRQSLQSAPQPSLFRCTTDTVVTAAASPPTGAPPTQLVDALLARVAGTDGGARASPAAHADIADLVQRLSEEGREQTPLRDEGLFSRYRVAYASTTQGSPAAGGLFRGRVGRLIFATRGLFQHLFAPDTVVNLVCFRVLGVLKGCVALRGRLTVVNDPALGPGAVQVVFEKPRVCFGSKVFEIGPGSSTVRLCTTYLDDRVRIGVGGRGSLFVFTKIAGTEEVRMADEWKKVFEVKPLPTVLLPLSMGAIVVPAMIFAPWYLRIALALLTGAAAFVLKRGGTARNAPTA